MIPLPGLSEIKRRRKALGLTQPALAKASGVSQSFIAKVEAGRLEPSYAKAAAIFAALDQQETAEDRTASQIMRRPVQTIASQERVSSALALMKRHGISQVPVLRRGSLVGMVTERGILDRVVKGESMEILSRLPVEDVMEDPFPTVSPDVPLNSILSVVAHNQAVLVVKRGEIVGIVTKSDLLR